MRGGGTGREEGRARESVERTGVETGRTRESCARGLWKGGNRGGGGGGLERRGYTDKEEGLAGCVELLGIKGETSAT